MNRSGIILGTFTVVFAVLISCTKDNGKQPSSTTSTTTTTGGTTGSTTGTTTVNKCDTITYTKHIKPIIDANCGSCHGAGGNSGGFLMTNYSEVKAKAETGKIKDRVIDGKAPGFMPPTGKLPAAQIELINCWLGNGLKQ